MSELSCDTPFIGRNETHDLSRYRKKAASGLSKPTVEVTYIMYILRSAPYYTLTCTVEMTYVHRSVEARPA